MKRVFVTSALASIIALSPVLSSAAEPKQEMIYGSQLMTQQERNEYRARLRAAKTIKERERIRAEHHERMKKRAKVQGVKLPDEPPAAGGGMGPGGGGMGPGGSGMGPGKGQGR